MIPATPAEPARPRIGARTQAIPPKKRAMNPIHSAKPVADSAEIWSPSAASPKVLALTVVMTATMTRASASMVRWAASFSIAIRRLPYGAAATRSRLPLAASPASVPDRARIDQRAPTWAKSAPYFQDM